MKVEVTADARRDIAAALKTSREQFGIDARRRYLQLINRALSDLRQPTEPTGSKPLSENHRSIRVYHLRNSRASTGSFPVGRPRHLIVYRRTAPDLIVVLRLLHDAMDLPAHLN